MNGNSKNSLLEQKPLLLSNIIYTQGKSIYGFYLNIKNVPGALADVSRVFANYNVNIVGINFTPSIEESEILLFIAADFSMSNIKPEDIFDKLVSLDKVISGSLVKPKIKGLLVDELHFPIIDIRGRRRIVLSQENLKFFVVGIRELLGSAGLALLYRQGVAIGEAVWERYQKIGINILEEAIKRLLLGGIALGRYKGEITKFSVEEGVIEIRLHRNWECEVAKMYNIPGPASYFERGVIAGLVKGYLGKEVNVEEVKCIAKGDPYCEFRIKIPKT